MHKGIVYEVAWEAIQDRILSGLRAARQPVPAGSIATVCHVSSLATREQILESLARLEESGRIRRRHISYRTSHAPLFETVSVLCYEVVGGGYR